MNKQKLPEGWKEVELGEVGQIVTGSTPPKKNPEYYGDSLPWIKTPDLANGMYVSNSKEKISELGRTKVRILPEGSVIVSCIGIIGKVAIAKCEMCTNQQINSIIPNKEIADSKFLYYLIKKIKPILEQRASSAVVPLLNKTEFSKFKINLPPLETQKKIVSLLEKAEKSKEWRKESDNLTKDFLKSVFLEMIRKYIVDKNMFVKLKDICFVKGGKRLPKGESFSTSKTNRPYLRVTDMINYSINKNSLKYISEEIFEKIRRYIISKDDIYITIAGTIGSSGTIPEYLDGASLTENAAKLVIKDKSKLNKTFLAYLINSEFCQLQIRKKTMAVGVPKLAIFRIESLDVPLPPIELQNKFASIVKQVEAMKEQQKHSKNQIDNLFNALMQKAFKGELKC